MASFLEDFTPFLGTGKRNEDGDTLEEFLEKYDQSKYESPSVTADIMVFKGSRHFTTVREGLSLLMVQRKNHPSIGHWALPGGFLEMREDLEEAAKRELQEETGLTDIPVQLVNTFGEVWRDPRNRIVTASYIAFVDNHVSKPKAGDDAAEAEWFDIEFGVKGESIITLNDKQVQRKLYQIKLTGPNNVKCSAIVREDKNCRGIIKERKLTVVESHNIAFDHARFIVDGLLYLDNARK